MALSSFCASSSADAFYAVIWVLFCRPAVHQKCSSRDQVEQAELQVPVSAEEEEEEELVAAEVEWEFRLV